VVEIDADEVETEAGVARVGPGGVAREQVHLARLEIGEALLSRRRHVAHLGRVAEHRRRDGAAQVHVDAPPHAFRVGLREPGEAGVRAAGEEPLAPHGVEGRLPERGKREKKREEKDGFLHEEAPSLRNVLTTEIWSGLMSVGAWPTSGISTTRALG